MRLLAWFTNRCPLGRKTGRKFVLTHNKTATKKYGTKMNININITVARTIINHTTSTGEKSSRTRRHINKVFIICTICVIYMTTTFLSSRHNTKQHKTPTAQQNRPVPPSTPPITTRRQNETRPGGGAQKHKKTAEIRRFLHIPPHKSP